MPKPLRYNYNNTLAGDVFSPITEDFSFTKGKRYFVSSLDERGAYLMDNFFSNGFVSSRERFITWPSLSACFSKCNPKTGELDPIPEPEERAKKSEYVSDHDRYLASIGAKSKHMIPDEIREQRELAEAKTPPATIRTRREIVPGVYGRVFINSHDQDANTVWVNVKEDFGCVEFNADQLREAAHLFNQLAEILEENARNG